jgi:large subunit ribosomal protein L17
MRHRVAGKKLDRNTKTRRALRLALAKSLIQHERIETTLAKAQFIEGHVEKLVTLAKRAIAKGDPNKIVHANRLVSARLGNNRILTKKIFDVLAPRYATRPGGYTRILKLGERHGDRAPMVFLEFVDRDRNS